MDWFTGSSRWAHYYQQSGTASAASHTVTRLAVILHGCMSDALHSVQCHPVCRCTSPISRRLPYQPIVSRVWVLANNRHNRAWICAAPRKVHGHPTLKRYRVINALFALARWVSNFSFFVRIFITHRSRFYTFFRRALFAFIRVILILIAQHGYEY